MEMVVGHGNLLLGLLPDDDDCATDIRTVLGLWRCLQRVLVCVTVSTSKYMHPLSRGLNWAFCAHLFKTLCVQEWDDELSLRVSLPVVDEPRNACSRLCLAEKSPLYGIIIPLANVRSVKVWDSEQRGCCSRPGVEPDGCGCSRTSPVTFSINEKDGCCSQRWKSGQKIVEVQLTEPFVWNECCCACSEKASSVVRFSTDDLPALMHLFKAGGVVTDGNAGGTQDSGVELEVNAMASCDGQ